MDKREKVARAIARSGLIPASREWKELLPETRDHYMQQADAAIAALEPVTVRICQKCGHPENNHPYRHMFVALAQEDT